MHVIARHFVSIVIPLVAFVALPVVGRAELIVNENFDYTSAQTSSGLDGGSGWDGTWQYSVRGYPQASVFGGLYPGNVVSHTGNMLLKLSSQTTTISRSLPNSTAYFVDGSTVWFSFFFQPGNPPSSNLNLGFVPSTNTAAGIGVTLTPEGGGGTLRARMNDTLSTDGYPLTLTNAWDNENRLFIVGCFRRLAGVPDQLQVWVNPPASALTSGELPAATMTVNAELVGVPSIFRVNNVLATDGPNLGYRLDEVRLATTLASTLTDTVAPRDVYLTTPPPPADGVHYYVSGTNGSDANPGTLERPFQTIRRIAAFLQPGQECVVRAGVYREVLRPRYSGTAGAPIVFSAYPGEDVVITGLDAVSGWTPAGGSNIYLATAPSALDVTRMQVFFNGQIGFQARWPNRTNDNLLQAQGATIATAGSDATKITSASIPANLPANYFDGGVVWVCAGSKWSSWRSPVTAFNPATKTITFQAIIGSKYEGWVVNSHNPSKGGTFYVSGALNLLDAEKEWYYDPARSELRIVPPAGVDPASALIEVQTRADAIDLSALSYVQVKGFRVQGSSANLTGSQYCVLEGLNFQYPAFTRADFGTNAAGGGNGVTVNGLFNTVRECEIGWTWGSGIAVSGSDNRVINNYIHDTDLLGLYTSGVDLNSNTTRNIVAWNTFARTGRDGIRINGWDNQVLHNDISGFGQICDDTGGTYTGGEGIGSIVAYNWVHDSAPTGMKAGIYLDNYTTGFTVHHNVIWGLPWTGIVNNRPSNFHSIFHNTVFGRIDNNTGWTGGQYAHDTAIGTVVANNLLSDIAQLSFGAVSQTNIASSSSLGFNTVTHEVSDTRDGLGAGTYIPGISPTNGTAPDVGAFQTGVDYPRPGHNFSLHPEVSLEGTSPVTQKLKNNIFIDQLTGWTVSPTGTAKFATFSGWNNPGPESRNSILAGVVSLSGGGRISQTVSDLVPGKVYSLWAYRKASAAMASTGVGIVFPDGTEYRFVFNGTLDWQLAQNFEFMVPAGVTEGSVFLWADGESGTCYFDNVGLEQKWYNNTLHYNPTRFATPPANQSALAGKSATFTATSQSMSTRTNRWEWQPYGTDTWLPLSSTTGITVSNDRDKPSVIVNPVRPDQNGDSFRCVSSLLTAQGFTYQAFSKPATLTVTGVALDKNTNLVGFGVRQYTITVNVPAGTPWSATSNLPWATVSPTSGVGGGTVTVTVSANDTGLAREGTIRIAGQDHLVRQSDGGIFSEWVESLGAPLRPPAAIPAGDGVSNLLKYAFGLDDPLQPAHSRQPRIVAEDQIEFLFYRAPHRTDVTYVVRASDTLTTPISEWPSVAQAEAGEPTESLDADLGVVETALPDAVVEVRLQGLSPDRPRRFYVLEVLLANQ